MGTANGKRARRAGLAPPESIPGNHINLYFVIVYEKLSCDPLACRMLTCTHSAGVNLPIAYGTG